MKSTLYPFGCRFRGNTSIKIKSAEVVPQGYLKDALQTNRNWESLWNDFVWEGWIKPQIDLAFANGANCIKASWGGWDGATQISTTSTTISRMAAMAAYIRNTYGGFTYWSMLGPQQAFLSSGALVTGNLLTEMQQVLAMLETLPGVVGCDLLNEINYSGPSAWGSAGSSAFNSSMAAIFAEARAGSPTLPLTVSVSVEQASNWNGGYQGYMKAAAPYVDFHDVHPYYGGDGNSTSYSSVPALADLAPMLASSWFKGRFFMGEVGVNQGMSAAAQTAFIQGLGSLTTSPYCYGGNLFCLADYNLSAGAAGEYGASNYQVQSPRPAVLTPFQKTWVSTPV